MLLVLKKQNINTSPQCLQHTDSDSENCDVTVLVSICINISFVYFCVHCSSPCTIYPMDRWTMWSHHAWVSLAVERSSTMYQWPKHTPWWGICASAVNPVMRPQWHLTTVRTWGVCWETDGDTMCCAPNWQKAERVWGITASGYWRVEALLVDIVNSYGVYLDPGSTPCIVQ